ncbi:hypothetical protein ACC870_38735, partial [Rhizobium ruizarguesonis]
NATTTKASDIIGKLQDVTHVFSSVVSASSGGGPDSSSTSSVGSATIVAVLSPIGERDRKQSEIENDIRQALSALPG